MIKWTTPTIKCTIPADLPLDYVLLTMKQNSTILEKKIPSVDIEDGVFYVTFEQKETAMFDINYDIGVQVNIMSGSTRLASRILNVRPTHNLHNEVIKNE